MGRRKSTPVVTVGQLWNALEADYGVAGSYGLAIEDIITAIESTYGLEAIYDVLGLVKGDYIRLYEHFEAITVADLLIPYTETVVGAAAATLYVDDLPSAIRLTTGANAGDSVTLSPDRTVSLQALGGTTLVFEIMLKLSHETDFILRAGLSNETTNIDRVWIMIDTAAAAPIDDGVIDGFRNGVEGTVDADLVSGLDLTVYHVYRLEFIPGTSIELFVDDASRGVLNVAANVPDDQAWKIHMFISPRAAAIRTLDIDYYRVWSE